MRRRRRGASTFAYIALLLGILIILSILMPHGFWWLVIGIGLIAFGLNALRSC